VPQAQAADELEVELSRQSQAKLVSFIRRLAEKLSQREICWQVHHYKLTDKD